MNKDIERARQLLADGEFFAAVRGENQLTSTQAGIGFLLSLYSDKMDLSGYAVADKIVGRAAAFLMILLNACEVYAQTISEGAVLLFKQHGIAFSYGVCTEYIVNRKGDGMCPMEDAVLGATDASTAAQLIVERLKQLRG